MLFIRVYFHPVLFQLRCQLCTPLTWGTTIRTNAERLFTIMIFNNVTGNYFHLKTDWTVAVLFPCDYWYFLSSVQSATSMREMISTAPFFFFLVLLRFLICCCLFGLLMGFALTAHQNIPPQSGMLPERKYLMYDRFPTLWLFFFFFFVYTCVYISL